MKESDFCLANNRRANKKFTTLLWNVNFRISAYKSPPLVTFQSQENSVNTMQGPS